MGQRRLVRTALWDLSGPCFAEFNQDFVFRGCSKSSQQCFLGGLKHIVNVSEGVLACKSVLVH
jgi:hypothetical protein